MPAHAHPGLADLPVELLELIVEPLELKERWGASQTLLFVREAPWSSSGGDQAAPWMLSLLSRPTSPQTR